MAEWFGHHLGRKPDISIQAIREARAEQVEEAAKQDAAKDRLDALLSQATNPFGARIKRHRKSMKDRLRKIQKSQKMAEKKKGIMPIRKIQDAAKKFERRNPELRAKMLQLLREQIKPGDDKDAILKKVKEFYEDISLVDDALEFLEETTLDETQRSVKEAKEEINENFGREIAAGKNISKQARIFGEKGLGSPTALRDMYRELTGNPREPLVLFEELSDKFKFKELKMILDFMLHSLGADMKAKGPSIPRGLLHRLLTETRSVQAILGVYRFFKGRMKLVNNLFGENEMETPEELDFENLAKAFVAFAKERYPSPEKLASMAKRLGIEKWVIAKIIVFSQLRDAVRELALQQVYRSVEHRDEVLTAIIELLEDLEDELEELEEAMGWGEEEGAEQSAEKEEEQAAE